jgi:hypothetical protein
MSKNKNLPELWWARNRHNNNLHRHWEWEEKLLTRLISPVIWKNDINNAVLSRIQPLIAIMLESVTELRNMFNFTVTKDWNNHWD